MSAAPNKDLSTLRDWATTQAKTDPDKYARLLWASIAAEVGAYLSNEQVIPPPPWEEQQSALFDFGEDTPAAATSAAVLSACGTYRYHLTRTLTGTGPPVVFVMLNPSTADASLDDPTIVRCKGTADMLGASSVHVVNLFAYRATKPANMWAHDGDIIGPENDHHLRTTFRTARNTGAIVIAAWGAHPKARERADTVCAMAELEHGLTVHALAVTKDGEPGHPLYLPKGLHPKKYYRETACCGDRNPHSPTAIRRR